jgi:hypothetical protein
MPLPTDPTIQDASQIVSNNAGWETPPALAGINVENAQKHYVENAPAVQTILAGQSPNATGQDRVKAAEALKAYSTPAPNEDFAGSHDIRWEKVLGAQNLGDIITGLTGGSDIREIGRNGAGIPVTTVYNARGDLRRYEWGNGQKISPEELQQLGPIASVRDISAERAAQYKAQGLAAPVIAAAQAASWGKTLNAASVAAKVSDTLIDNANEQKNLSQSLVASSVNPATRALLAKVNTLTASKSQQAQVARDTLSKFISGTATTDDWNTAKDVLGGIDSVVSYKQGEGLKVGNNKVTSTQDINELADKVAASNSAANSIQSNATNLANEAQILAAGGKIQNLDAITRLIGLKAQGKFLADQLDAAGGIPGFTSAPNVNHATTDSFTLAGTNAEYTLAQAKAAKAFAQTVLQQQKNAPYSAPNIGQVEAEFASSPTAKQLRSERTQNVVKFLDENKAAMEKLNAAPVAKEIVQQVNGAPVTPPALPAMPAGTPPGSKPPVSSTTKSETKTAAKSSPEDDLLRKLFPIKGK